MLSILVAFFVNKQIQIAVDSLSQLKAVKPLTTGKPFDLIHTTIHHVGNIKQVALHYFFHPLVLIRHLLVDLGTLQIVSMTAFLLLWLSHKLPEKSYRSLSQFAYQALYVITSSAFLVFLSGDVIRMLCTVVPFAAISIVLIVDKFNSVELDHKVES